MQDERGQTDVMREVFGQPVAHIRELGIRIEARLPRGVVMRLPYREELVGNPDSGVLHGGAVTTLVDSASGFAAMAALPEPGPVATLDLRIDYLRPAVAGEDLLVRADCYRLTKRIAFVRAEAYQRSPEDPVAAAMGTFMITGTVMTKDAVMTTGTAPGRPDDGAAPPKPGRAEEGGA